jgi:hypothetical protein
MLCSNCRAPATAKVLVTLGDGDDPYTWFMCERHAQSLAAAPATAAVETRVEPVEPEPRRPFFAGTSEPMGRLAAGIVGGFAGLLSVLVIGNVVAANAVVLPVVLALVVAFAWTARL